jgi:membrane protease YdiL (CAAX protease family)
MSEIAGLVTTFIPLFFIAWLANLAEGRRERGEDYNGLAIVTYVFVVLLYGAAIFGGILMHLISAMAAVAPLDPALAAPFADFEADSMLLLGVGLWLPSLIGILCLLPPVRRLIARVIPIDPESIVHAVALSLSMLAFVNLLVTLGVGLGTFADVLAENQDAAGNTVVVLWIQQILTALLAMIGVGWLTRRNWGATLERLALVIPTGRQWLIGIGFGLGMVPVVLLIEALASALGMTADADVERLTEQLLGSLFTTPLGILTIGLSAGLGEETLFRGAVQPRFGLVLTSIFFALIHSQYGITLSTLVVLLLGLVLGWQRLRYNTSTAMITHAVYNMTLGLLAYLGTSFLDV